MIRFLDFFFSLIGILILLPFLIIIAFLVKVNSRGPVFYMQRRVGYINRDFLLFKFRTMRVNSDKMGLLTVGGHDPRITSIGYILRKYKLDELPQLINVLKGDMSLVGPRPEVRKYVNFYSSEQMRVLNIRPGITDLASIHYSNENELLEKAENPEEFYIQKIMPDKIRLNMEYINSISVSLYLRIIFKTIFKIVK